MKWYEQPYVNTRDWILNNLEYLNLDPLETAVVLLIDFYNASHRLITSDGLQRALHTDNDSIDQTISSLKNKHYLSIKSTGSTIVFDLSGLYEYEHPTYTTTMEMSIVELIQQQFGTLLSMNDIEKVAHLKDEYGDVKIRAALREAMLYGKKSIDYMAAILRRSANRQ